MGFSLSIQAQPLGPPYRILEAQDVRTGAERLADFLLQLQGKKVAVVANHTSRIGETHLVDYLLEKQVEVVRVFAPEHGFRGELDAGQKVNSGKDARTGLPITSLYGANKKPSRSDLADVEVVLFDIQDVGVRFYTYISTMHYVMEACAELSVNFWVLDRPNPLGFYVDGPVLDPEFQSFVGLHPIPLVHGLTVGELAQMINGEGWLNDQVQCSLRVIRCEDYTHNDLYQLPVAPSPNLPNMTAVYLYPSLGLFEGTRVSVGRGTEYPFQVFGSPYLSVGDFTFTPEPTYGARHPKFEGKECRGYDLRHMDETFASEYLGVYLRWLLLSHKHHTGSKEFFLSSGFFHLLAGTDVLRQQVEQGLSEKEIRASWGSDLEDYLERRQKYLLYPDFTRE